MSPESVHVMPNNGEHPGEGLDCWCSPRYGLPCDECPTDKPGCWKCDGGLITLTRSEAEATDARLVIVHNR